MNIKNRFIKIRFSPEEYSDITRRADKLGINRCDYIRNQLNSVHQQIDIRAELQDLRALAVAQSEPGSRRNRSTRIPCALSVQYAASGAIHPA